jgi:hypothetical protein
VIPLPVFCAVASTAKDIARIAATRKKTVRRICMVEGVWVLREGVLVGSIPQANVEGELRRRKEDSEF